MKLRLTSLVLLVAALASCATTTEVEAPAEPTPEVAETVRQPLGPRSTPPPLLWEVRSDDGASIYLFGTMHFGTPREALPPEVDFALAYCETFVLEANPAAADPRRLADLMMLGDGPSLDERLGPERWERLLEMIDGKFAARVARRLQPWVLEAVLIEELLPQAQPMEFSLLEEAKRRHMEVAYLENWERQIRLLNESVTVHTLAEIVDDPQGFRRRTTEMSRDYVRGDLSALEDHIFGEYEPQALFETRNREWIPLLKELARNGDVFVAVGAGHLIGDHSILELFEQEGYRVRRLGESPTQFKSGTARRTASSRPLRASSESARR